MRCVERIGRPEFTLDDVYAFEPHLSRLYPDNRNVRPKIRQQLQVLRDHGWLFSRAEAAIGWRASPRHDRPRHRPPHRPLAPRGGGPFQRVRAELHRARKAVRVELSGAGGGEAAAACRGSMCLASAARRRRRRIFSPPLPEKFFTTDHYRGFPAILVRLAAVDERELRALLTAAWRCQAPRSLARRLEAAPAASRERREQAARGWPS